MKKHIKVLRKRQKLSVKALAEKSGVPVSTIRKFEDKGNISLRQFLMLMEGLGQLNRARQLAVEEDAEPTSIEEVLKNA